jgi:ATP-dependent helicase HrpB
MAVDLPIDARMPEILASLRAQTNLVLVAEPGAGKTTRLPRAMLEHGFADKGHVLVLEPRRLATRFAAERVADELGEKLGERVGYQVRFEKKTSDRTRLFFLTEGLLSRRLARDPMLRGVSAVVFDEFHERNVHSDLGLAMLRRAQRERPDLRLIVTSATLDAARVASFLDAPVIEVAGRTFPVTVDHEKVGDDRPLERRVSSAVRELLIELPDGDLLVFLPGASEIRRAGETLETLARERGFDVLPLHGEMPAAEQDRAVRPGPRRKVILATNVAETSITIPTVVAVIDSGLARVAKHSPWTGLPSLEVAKVSQSSAVQRAGRAGRVRAGRCRRLYTEHDFNTRPRFDEPEIRRMDLAEVALVLASAGEDVRTFPYFEAPADVAIDAARTLLERLSAVDDRGITKLGRDMLELPVHPRLARLAIAAADDGAGPRGALLAALLGERDVLRAARTSVRGDRHSTDEVSASDLLVRLDRVERAEEEGARAGILDALGLDGQATRAALRTRDRLVSTLRTNRAPMQALEDEEDTLLRATLAGFPDRIGRRRNAKSDHVVFAGGGAGVLSPGSVVKEAEFLVAVDAQKGQGGVQIRLASAIEVEWLLELYPDRIREVRELRFDAATGQVETRTALVFEGLTLDESVKRDATGSDVEAVLAKAALDAGLEKFWDRDAIESLRLRLVFAARSGLAIEPPSDATMEAALRRLCRGKRSFADLRGTNLVEAMLEDLPATARAKLDRFAPTHVPIAGRPKVDVCYVPDGAPYIESRLQDFFGTKVGPTIADGRVPLVLHLLSPNQRAVQVTTDLAGFWDRHYPSVRKELMRQYPRHYWPDDPRTAEPLKPKPRVRR